MNASPIGRSGVPQKVYPLKGPALAVVLALSIIASTSTWIYIARVLKPQQIADAALHQRPRGNLSDLYPRWLGARELLLRGRNPYSPEITREIQRGYYGRPINPSLPDDPKDQQGFAYPAYVVFLLAPTIHLPFEIVQTGFRWLLFLLAAAVAILSLRVLRWRLSPYWIAIVIFAMLGWLPVVQGIKLQQLTLVVAALLAGSVACVANGWLLPAGVLLALATIKPQLAWPIVLWLLLWSASDWRARRKFVFAFAFIMTILVGGAEFLLHGWLFLFIHAIGQYHQYTQNQSVLVWMFGSILGRIAEVVSVVLCGSYIWRVRREPATSAEFGTAFALVMALAVIVVPMFAPYNQILLAPAIFVLARSVIGEDEPTLPAIRLASVIAAMLLAWPWIATVLLSAASPWLTPGARNSLWPMPFYSNFILPIFIFGLTWLNLWVTGNWMAGNDQNHSGLRANAASE